MKTLFANISRWQRRTFGSADRRVGIIKHLKKEIDEVEKNPDDPEEWIDIAFLSFHGFCQTVEKIFGREVSSRDLADLYINAFQAKFLKNQERDWPPQPPTEAVEHKR